MTLTVKEQAEKRRLDRKIMLSTKATRKEVLRALELRRKQTRK